MTDSSHEPFKRRTLTVRERQTNPLHIPVLQIAVARFLPARSVGVCFRLSKQWMDTLCVGPGSQSLWTSKYMETWPVNAKELLVPDKIQNMVYSSEMDKRRKNSLEEAISNTFDNVFHAYRRRALSECRASQLLDGLLGREKKPSAEWSRDFAELTDDLKDITAFLWELHGQAEARHYTGETIGAEWVCLRAAWSASLREATDRLKHLLEAPEEAEMHDFLTIVSGFMEPRLSGPEGRVVIELELDMIAEEVSAYLSARASIEEDGAARRSRIGLRRRSPREVICDICSVLFGNEDDEGAALKSGVFQGATTNYYHPSMSSLHGCLKSRKGLPLTLSVLLIVICRRLGIRNLHGVGAPGHFVCKYEMPVETGVVTDGKWILLGGNGSTSSQSNENTLFYVDPHGGGAIIDSRDMQDIVRRNRLGLVGRADDRAIKESLMAASNVNVWSRVCANLNNQYFRQLSSSYHNDKGFSQNNLFSIAALSLQGILQEYSISQPPYEQLEEYTALADTHVRIFDSLSRDIQRDGHITPQLSMYQSIANATTISRTTFKMYNDAAKSFFRIYYNMPEIQRRACEMLICPQLFAGTDDDEYAEWDSVTDPENYTGEEDEHRRSSLMFLCHFPVGCIVKPSSRIRQETQTQLYGVVFGITEEIGLVFHVLWNNNTMQIHQVMDLSARFEDNETPSVTHPCLGRYFRRLVVLENNRSYFEPNAMCYARYGKLGCCGRDEN